MVIPNAEKPIQQWKFNLAIAFTLLIALIAVNIGLLISSVTANAESAHLNVANDSLSQSLLETQDKINSLENINQSKGNEIDQLKASLMTSTEFLEARLEEMDEAQEYIVQLVEMFNVETNSSLVAPVSRSFSRTAQANVDASTGDALFFSEAVLISDVDALVTDDEISTILAEQSEAYTELVSNLESQLSYLECRPDFYPASGTLTSNFGYRKDPFTGRTAMHNGIDISNTSGTTIYSAGAGVVTFAGWSGSFGNVIIVDHGYGYETAYAHCKTMDIEVGTSVQKGDAIATMGSSGRATGTHLHFEIRYNGTAINPLNILNTN
jgi:murein DD-endopeptidase MepM/ murein hydrolase activator NlpD